MPVPAEITAIIEKLNGELNQIQQNTTHGSNLTGELLTRFPGNAILTQCFAYFNIILFVLKIAKIQIQTISSIFDSQDATSEVIKEIGAELEVLLSKTLELKIDINRTTKSGELEITESEMNREQIIKIEKIQEIAKLTEQKAKEMGELSTAIAWKFQKKCCF